MRLVIAKCTVDYLGRLTGLPSARRLLLFKADGSVSVHADYRAYKPLNWMSPPCWVTEVLDGPLPVWVVENKTGEQLRITVEGIAHESTHDLGVDPGLVKDGVEAHLQALLAEHVELLGAGYTLVRREYMTAIGICRGRGPVFDHPGSSGCRRGTCGHYVQGIAAAATQGHCRSNLSDRGATP